MPRLLVLGGSGFLGAHVVRAGLARGWDVVAASRDPDALHGIPGTEAAEHARFDGLEHARAPELAQGLVRELSPEAVILCTALPSIAGCEGEPANADALNAQLPAAVARACATLAVRLVHVSTDLVFGGEPPRASGYREEDATDPRSAYGRTKAAGERAVLAAHPGALVVRLPLLTGDSFGRNQGASDSLLAAALRGERPSLFEDEWRTPLDVAQAGEALVELAGRGERGLLHVAGPERLSRLELGLRCLRAAGHADSRALVRATRRAESGQGDRPRDVALDAARARALLRTPLAALVAR